ncbi:MAG TPA: 6-phosphogluconolactonase, partial [Candidatus Limnocylindrales bacterium]
MNGEPRVIVVADPDAASAEAASRIAAILRGSVEARGRADWATTGGSTPIGIYRRLAEPPLVDEVPWSGVHLWWGDDRYVPRDHRLSNVMPADQILLRAGALGAQTGWGETPGDVTSGYEPAAHIPVANVHPFPLAEAIGEARGPEWAAERYEVELRAAGLDAHEGWPVFDLVLVGIGPDGHLMSVFPGSEAFDSTAWALAIPAPTHIEPHVPRVTLNPGILDVARVVLAVVTGSAKSAVLAEVFGTARDPRRWPAQLVRRTGATWIVDQAAAA